MRALLLIGLYGLSGCRCAPEPVSECWTAADCPPDDGLFCNGRPVCRSGWCATDLSCGVGERCDEAGDRCEPCADPSCVRDGGLTPDGGVACEALSSGRACTSERACGSDECHAEAYLEWGSRTAAGGPGRPFRITAFPGGYCAQGCDASRLNDECGDCADCNGDLLNGTMRLPLYYSGGPFDFTSGVCRERCTPSSTGTGCRRSGYTCDLETGTCMEACTDDAQCQIVFRDLDGDGSPELLDRGAGFPAYCDRVTGRCRMRGRAGARIGDRCREDDECTEDGICLFDEGGAEGICSRLGCRAEGFECPAGTVCDVRNVPWWARSACLPTCTVGAEDGTPGMLGPLGGHPECGRGRACAWNGVAERAGPGSGSCIGGEYNDRTTSNVGAACTSADECFSPFGYGTCAFGSATWSVSSGFCTVRHCATFLNAAGEEVEGLLPGVEIAAPICDPARGEECVALAGHSAPDTYCLVRCESASTCAPGYACVEFVAGRSYCWPFCLSDFECRAGARCATRDGTSCTGDGSEQCLCG